MFEQAEIEYINEIIASDDVVKYSKRTLKALYVIYDKHNETKTTDCFCSLTVRKIYFKSFVEWYEKNT